MKMMNLGWTQKGSILKIKSKKVKSKKRKKNKKIWKSKKKLKS